MGVDTWFLGSRLAFGIELRRGEIVLEGLCVRQYVTWICKGRIGVSSYVYVDGLHNHSGKFALVCESVPTLIILIGLKLRIYLHFA